MYIFRTQHVKPHRGIVQTAHRIDGIAQREDAMPKKTKTETAAFGARLTELRKAAGFTQQDLAAEIGVSRRMIAYYEVQSEHPPTHLLPAIAKALHVSTDELLGLAPVKRAPRAKDSRLQRRLQQIEKLPPEERRQVLQVVDAFIERGQLKRKTNGQPA
jgi:transcriptional regulator with XRE-family HTH domain